jgi:hypothetical protein
VLRTSADPFSPCEASPPSSSAHQRSRDPSVASQGGQLTGTAFVFDLDGTLVDSVYQHVLAWREALEAKGMAL